MRSAMLIFWAQVLIYGVAAANTAAIANREYLSIGLTAALLFLVSSVVVTVIARNGLRTPQIAAGVLGSVIGDLLGVWLASIIN